MVKRQTFLKKFRTPIWVSLGIFFIFVVGWIDHATGSEISVSLFYLIPISMITWQAGKWPGFAVSLLAAFIWLMADITNGKTYSHTLIPYWNSVIRLGFFLIVTMLLSMQKHALQTQKDLAHTDFTTGAINARFFLELLQGEINRCKRFCHPFSLVYVDADHFKSVNDNCGHEMGNAALRIIAATFRENLRKTDIVARLGGDEFALLLPETDHSAADIVVAKLNDHLVEAMVQNGWPITFSIGVITFLNAPGSADEAIKMADDLMYKAKNGGKNSIYYAVWTASTMLN
jgi:diguanylate cyclase (GGDEF)-like protein